MIAKLAQRLPFYYGWVIIGAAFALMALAVNARTAFSLFLPPILAEFAWDRGVTAGAFSFGFLISAFLSPVLGQLMDRKGPQLVAQLGVAAAIAGLLLAAYGQVPWHLYLTLGVLVGIGSVCLGYSGQALYLPNWFVQRRGLAMGIAYSGVGVGSIILLPWLQRLIDQQGWRHATWTLGLVILVLGMPLTFLLRHRPQDLALLPDGALPASASASLARRSVTSTAATSTVAASSTAVKPKTNVVDANWVAIDWTLARALRTSRFWWLASGYFGSMYAWYAVQVHQTKYLVDIGFTSTDAAWALGAVSLAGIPGQIVLGHISDRVGREIVFVLSNVGFVATYLLLLALGKLPGVGLLYLMIVMQGAIGYGLTAVFGAIPAEIFEGKHFGSIFGTLMLAAISGGAFGPWLTGFLFDRTGNYVLAFWLGVLASIYAAVAIVIAAPGKVRAVAGRMKTVA